MANKEEIIISSDSDSDSVCGVEGCTCGEEWSDVEECDCPPTSPPPCDPIDYAVEEVEEEERSKRLAKEVLEQLRGEPEPKRPKVE